MYEEQHSGDTPFCEKGVMNVAVSLAHTASHNARQVTATPIAGPFTAAIKGLGNLTKLTANSLQKLK